MTDTTIRTFKTLSSVALLALASALVMPGCEEDDAGDAFEEGADAVEDAADDVGDAIEDAADEIDNP